MRYAEYEVVPGNGMVVKKSKYFVTLGKSRFKVNQSVNQSINQSLTLFRNTMSTISNLYQFCDCWKWSI